MDTVRTVTEGREAIVSVLSNLSQVAIGSQSCATNTTPTTAAHDQAAGSAPGMPASQPVQRTHKAATRSGVRVGRASTRPRGTRVEVQT